MVLLAVGERNGCSLVWTGTRKYFHGLQPNFGLISARGSSKIWSCWVGREGRGRREQHINSLPHPSVPSPSIRILPRGERAQITQKGGTMQYYAMKSKEFWICMANNLKRVKVMVPTALMISAISAAKRCVVAFCTLLFCAGKKPKKKRKRRQGGQGMINSLYLSRCLSVCLSLSRL